MITTAKFTTREESCLFSTITAQLVTLFLTPGMESEFAELYAAQNKLATLFGYEGGVVDKIFQMALASPEAAKLRATLPPDVPSSPDDLCDCGDVGCCDGEEEVDEHEDILDRLSGLESENTRTIERMNRLHERLDTQRGMIDAALASNRDRTAVIQKEVQHWHTRVTDLHNELVALQKSVRELLTWTTTLRCEPQPDLDEIDD